MPLVTPSSRTGGVVSIGDGFVGETRAVRAVFYGGSNGPLLGADGLNGLNGINGFNGLNGVNGFKTGTGAPGGSSRSSLTSMAGSAVPYKRPGSIVAVETKALRAPWTFWMGHRNDIQRSGYVKKNLV